jgi:hypothetical protein
LGLGWGYRWSDEPTPETVTWESYREWAVDQWGSKAAPVRALHDADPNGLIWTRTADGMYYLARFTDGSPGPAEPRGRR